MEEFQSESSNGVGVPGTPGIKEAKPESGTPEFLDVGNKVGGVPSPEVRKVNLRAEIDTTPPFGSVKEAVTRFGGSWGWPPLYKLGESGNVIEEFDLKKVEEQATELEKDLIVKELETLDVLEELGTKKRIVEELKRKLQQEVPKCLTITESRPCERTPTPAIKEVNKENHSYFVDNHEQLIASPFHASSPELILTELKQAKVNLGKTISDLGAIQSSVESLNKKLKKEKVFLERTRERLASSFYSVPVQEENHDHVKLNLPNPNTIGTKSTYEVATDVGRHFNSSEQYKAMVEPTHEISDPTASFHQKEINMNTVEMRWIAAKKMEEAAKAAEALALAEMKDLTNAEKPSELVLPEPEKVGFPLGVRSHLTLKDHMAEELSKKGIDTKFGIDCSNISGLSILKWMEEATEEFLHSKQVLEDALNRVEIANRKQHAAEEALRKWIPEVAGEERARVVYNVSKHSGFGPAESYQNSPVQDIGKRNRLGNGLRLRPAVSMRDVLSRKQVLSEAYVARNEVEEQSERQKVALSQMLRALRGDLTLSPKSENVVSEQKPFVAPQRKKLGFIQISLPLTRPNKRRT